MHSLAAPLSDEATLTVPDLDARDDYVMCLYENGCGGARFCTNDPEGPRFDPDTRTWVVRLSAAGTCGVEDNKSFAVQVRRRGEEQPDACESYGLTFAFGFAPRRQSLTLG